MRFLVVSNQKYPMPPEMVNAVFAGMKAFEKQYIGNKKMEQIWSFAGSRGGGGIVNVNSLEELDAIVAEYPFGPFSDTTIYPLTDLDRSLDNALNAFKKMMPPKI